MFKNNEAGRMLAGPSPKFKERKVQKKKGADVSGIVLQDHGKYQIKAGRLSGTYVARAFPMPPAKTQGLIAEAKGESEEAAIAALKQIIEARDAQRSEDRRLDEAASLSIPTEMEFLEALRSTRLSAAQVAMLKALSVASQDGLTFRQLASAAGYKSQQTGEKVFQKAGEQLADFLGIEVTGGAAADKARAARILAVGTDAAEDAPTVWIIHPELNAAVRAVL